MTEEVKEGIPGSVESSGSALRTREAVRSGLSDLLARVEAATGADRALDAALQTSLLDGQHIHWGCGGLTNGFTASLDAALALVERVLPGWTVAHISQQDDKTWFAELREGYLTSYNRVALSETAAGKRPKTPALALLAALLKALTAQEAGQ